MNVLQMFHTLFIMDVNSQTLPKLEAGRITETVFGIPVAPFSPLKASDTSNGRVQVYSVSSTQLLWRE